jgi:hypothetical protein
MIVKRIKGMTIIFPSEEAMKEVLGDTEMEDITDANKE